MSRKDKLAMLCCYLIVFIPLAGMVLFCVVPDTQVNRVVSYIDGAKP